MIVEPRAALEQQLGDVEQLGPLAALALHLAQQRERRDHRAHRRHAVRDRRAQRGVEELRAAIAVLEPLHPLEAERAQRLDLLAVITRALGAQLVMALELVPPVGAGQEGLVQEVGARLVDVLGEHALEQLLEPLVLGRLEPQDPRGADQHTHRRRLVEPLGLVGEPLDLVGPELGIVVDRGERVLDPHGVRRDLERALEDR